MFPDGVCRVTDNYYTKTVQFQDINYQLNQNEDKTAIFDGWCDFLNYFDSSIRFQLSFINLSATRDTYARRIAIPLQGDCFDKLRTEYTGMLQSQLARGNNGLIKTKYLTFGVEADSLKAAKPRLERIETDILNNFRRLGVQAEALNGMERLRLLHGMLHMDEPQPFRFSWDWLAPSGLSVKDFIAPGAFEFKTGRQFRMGKKLGAVSFVQILAPELNDRMLADFLDMESSVLVNLHVQSVDQVNAIKTVKRKITDLDKSKIEEQKKAVRAGYDMDIIPSDLNTYGGEAKRLLEDLQSRNERMFLVTALFLNTAKTKQALDNAIFQTAGIAQKYNCVLKRLDYQQEEGLMSSVPLGVNHIPIKRALTTTSTAIFVPFTTQELFQGGEALYYGLNALSNNLIMVDRKRLKTPNGLILGTPGSGKSFATKREILNVFLITDDDIIICDPEGEYFPLVNALNGEVIKISAKSNDYINPMEVNLDVIYHPEKYRINGDVEDIDTIIADKAEFITSFCEVIMKKPQNAELNGDEVSMIDLCVKDIYKKYLYNDPKPENMPTLQDFYERLNFYAPDKPAAQNIANSLQLYVTGSQNVFNHRSNVDTQNRVVCFDIRELGTTLRKAGMLIVQHMVWTRVSQNRSRRKSTRYYVDEFHLLLNQPQTANYSIEMWKRFRKWGGIITGISQNVTDFLGSLAVESIVGNSDFILMLNQHSGDQKILAEKLNISKHQISFVNNSNAGEGLLFYGNVIIPFADRYPQDTRTYALMSTKPDEIQT